MFCCKFDSLAAQIFDSIKSSSDSQQIQLGKHIDELESEMLSQKKYTRFNQCANYLRELSKKTKNIRT